MASNLRPHFLESLGPALWNARLSSQLVETHFHMVVLFTSILAFDSEDLEDWFYLRCCFPTAIFLDVKIIGLSSSFAGTAAQSQLYFITRLRAELSSCNLLAQIPNVTAALCLSLLHVVFPSYPSHDDHHSGDARGSKGRTIKKAHSAPASDCSKR